MFDWRMIESIHVLIEATGPASDEVRGGTIVDARQKILSKIFNTYKTAQNNLT